MRNSDYESVNLMIPELKTRTADSPGLLNVSSVREELINIAAAEAKHWTVFGPVPSTGAICSNNRCVRMRSGNPKSSYGIITTTNKKMGN